MFALYVAGDDYNGDPITIDIPAGVMVQPFMINIVDDNVTECIERFSVVMISTTTCGVTTGNNNSTEVVIKDDENDGKLTSYACSYISVCFKVVYL